MLDKFKKALLAQKNDNPTVDDQKRVSAAVCALLIEMANFDDDFHEDEEKVIIAFIQEKFGLTSDEADELIKTANEAREKSIDLWQFTNLINQNYSKEDKIELLEILWKVVYADGRLAGQEDFLMHKLAKLLKLDHRDLIGVKLSVKGSHAL